MAWPALPWIPLAFLLVGDVLALVGARVHSLAPGAEPAVRTVLVEDGRIVALGPGLEVPPGARRLDVSGLHLIPGLIDNLAYHDPEHDSLYVAAGVTLVCDHGSDLGRVLDERASAARDREPGPALRTAGAVLDGVPPATSEALVLRDAREAEVQVPRLLEAGADFLSVQLALGEEPYRKVLELAHAPAEGGRRVQVWGPLPRALRLEQALAAGQDGVLFLDAFLPPGRAWDEVSAAELAPAVELAAERGVRVTPLLRGTARNASPPPGDAPELALLGPHYAALWREEAERRAQAFGEAVAQRVRRSLGAQRALLKALDEAGVALVPGSGAPHPWLMPGRGLAEELREWEAAGLPAARVLELATRGAARSLGLEGRGTLEPGAVADLVALRADPRASAAALAEVELAVVRGRLLERKDLDARLEAVRREQSEAREAAARPLAIPAPDAPEGEAVLSGYAETRAQGGRIAAERWKIVREKDGSLAFCSRRLTPASPRRAEVTVQSMQRVKDAKLDGFAVRLLSGGHEILVKGLAIGGSWRVERRADGVFVDNKAARERIAAVDAGSATTLMLLACTQGEGHFPVLRFHEGLEGEVVRWDLALEEDGDHWFRTPEGLRAAGFEESGALKAVLEQLGTGVTLTESKSIDLHGGPGLPLPAEKLKRMRAAAGGSAAEGKDG